MKVTYKRGDYDIVLEKESAGWCWTVFLGGNELAGGAFFRDEDMALALAEEFIKEELEG